MTHGYSLRPNANGRRGRKSTDNPENITSASTGSARQEDADIIDEPEGHPVEADNSPANPPALSSVHKRPAPPQHGDEQRLEARRQRGITSSSTITTSKGPTRYWVDRPPETSEAVQEGRRRVEAKHRVEAVRIQREQLERSYRQDMSGLHDRIAILRRECEEEVARARLEWERKCAIERGEAVEADEEEEGEGEEGEMEYDEEGQTEVGSADSAPTETWSLNDYDHDHSSTFPLVGSARPAMLAPLAPPPLQRLRRSPLFMAVPSSLRQPEVIESGGPSTSHGLPPLRRQPAQLLPFTFVSGDPATVTNTDSGGDDDDGRTDQDSEMGEA